MVMRSNHRRILGLACYRWEHAARINDGFTQSIVIFSSLRSVPKRPCASCIKQFGFRVQLRTHTWLARCILLGVVGSALFVSSAWAQSELPDCPQPQAVHGSQTRYSTHPQGSGQSDYSKHHIFWIIPNYREDESGAEFTPLSAGEKWKMAFDDSFDPTAFLVAGVFAGTSMLQRQYAFNDGLAGFGQYYAGAFADQAIGNIMTEAVFPIVLHQDPRYFVKGTGGFWRRTGYAMSREFITRGDDGRNHFNTSELGGNAVAAGISNLYYPAENRSLANTANKWGQQIGLDAAFNIMKEFWPDIRQKMEHEKDNGD